MWSDAVPYAELVEDVRIGSRKISYGIVAEHQAFEHGLVNDAANSLLVGTDRLQTCIFNGQFNYFDIDAVEINDTAAFILLIAKWHKNKAKGFHCFSESTVVIKWSVVALTDAFSCNLEPGSAAKLLEQLVYVPIERNNSMLCQNTRCNSRRHILESHCNNFLAFFRSQVNFPRHPLAAAMRILANQAKTNFTGFDFWTYDALDV